MGAQSEKSFYATYCDGCLAVAHVEAFHCKWHGDSA